MKEDKEDKNTNKLLNKLARKENLKVGIAELSKYMKG